MAVPPALPGGYQLWHFYPSVPGGVIMAVVFLGLTLGHLWFVIRSGKNFCIPLIVGGLCKTLQADKSSSSNTDSGNLVETVGYSARATAHYNPASTIAYAIQSLLILLAPIIFAASVYMYLGRIIHAVGGEKYCLVPARFLTKIFVVGDVVCFLVQAAGGGVLANAKTSLAVNMGEKVILAGLLLQIIVFGFFIVVGAIFQARMRDDASSQNVTGLPWQRSLAGLYAVSALITLRNVVRTIEYGQGSGSYLLTHEWTLYIFDALLMALALAICLLWYRGYVGSRNWQKKSQGRADPLKDISS